MPVLFVLEASMLKLCRSCLRLGFIFVWTSVVLIPLGVHLQTLSPQFEKFERQVYANTIATNAHGDGPHVYFLIFWWPFVGCWCVFIGLIFTFGVLIIRRLSFWHRDISLLAAGAFGLGCTAGAAMGFGESLQSLQWGIVPLGIAYLMSAAGLAFGGAGTIGILLCTSNQAVSRSATNI